MHDDECMEPGGGLYKVRSLSGQRLRPGCPLGGGRKAYRSLVNLRLAFLTAHRSLVHPKPCLPVMDAAKVVPPF